MSTSKQPILDLACHQAIMEFNPKCNDKQLVSTWFNPKKRKKNPSLQPSYHYHHTLKKISSYKSKNFIGYIYKWCTHPHKVQGDSQAQLYVNKIHTYCQGVLRSPLPRIIKQCHQEVFLIKVVTGLGTRNKGCGIFRPNGAKIQGS